MGSSPFLMQPSPTGAVGGAERTPNYVVVLVVVGDGVGSHHGAEDVVLVVVGDGVVAYSDASGAVLVPVGDAFGVYRGAEGAVQVFVAEATERPTYVAPTTSTSHPPRSSTTTR